VLCLGPGADRARQQARIAEENGCTAVIVSPGAAGPLSVDGVLPPALLSELRNVDAVVCEAGDEVLRPLRAALAARDGPILPLLGEADMGVRCRIERSVSIDTTSAGGNAQLLAAAAG
jgi:RHH-type proline utilization regulon transcriptional repressor/proline dehydrogenase/delta 1-pyrroline-5-carboxylate dehydrogenase